MFGSKKAELVNLESATGFDLVVYDGNSAVLDSVSTWSADTHSRTREGYLLVSAARTLAYMVRFYYGGKTERDYYMAHLRDFRRKLDAFIEEG